MDTKEAKVQLPSYLIGDLSPKEAAMLEGHLDVDPQSKAAKESLARQLTPVINLQAPEVSPAALAKLFMDARRELVKPENQPEFNWRDSTRFLLRVAALVVAAAVLGLIVANVIPQSDIIGEIKTANGDTRAVRLSELIETPQGVPLTLRLKGTGARLDLDGSAAVMVTGRGHDSRVEIMRGRVIVDAGHHALSVVCGTNMVIVNELSVAAIDFDTPFERIRGKGAVVELQRQTVSHVARVAERLFGGLIDTSKLPTEVAERRVSIYGVGLRRDEFMATFKNAGERFGIVFKEDGKNVILSYNSGTAGNNVDESESVLKIAPLKGGVDFSGEKKQSLNERRSQVLVLAGGEARTFADSDGAAKAQRMVVWAGRTDLPHFQLTETVSNYISDKSTGGGKVVTLGLALPTGTVLSSDSMRYRGALVHVGEVITLDLPGAKNGKLMGVMSSGIEVEGEDATRYFVPVSNSSTR